MKFLKVKKIKERSLISSTPRMQEKTAIALAGESDALKELLIFLWRKQIEVDNAFAGDYQNGNYISKRPYVCIKREGVLKIFPILERFLKNLYSDKLTNASIFVSPLSNEYIIYFNKIGDIYNKADYNHYREEFFIQLKKCISKALLASDGLSYDYKTNKNVNNTIFNEYFSHLMNDKVFLKNKKLTCIDIEELLQNQNYVQIYELIYKHIEYSAKNQNNQKEKQ